MSAARQAVIALVLCAVLSVGAVGPVAAVDDRSGRQCHGLHRLVWTHEGDAAWDLYRLNCHASATALTETPAGQGGSENPRWSGCHRLFFDGDRAGRNHVFAMNPRTGVVSQVTDTAGYEYSAAPTPDGTHLVIEHSTARQLRDGLFRVPVGTKVTRSQFHRLTLNPAASRGGFDSGADVSPNGRSIVFARLLGGADGSVRSAIFTIGMDGQHLRQLTPYRMNAFQPRWSGDGRRIAFSDNADNYSDTVSANVYVMRRDGSHRRKITHSSNGSHSFAPVWGPGGHSLIYVQVVAGALGTRLVARDLQTRSVRVLYRGTQGVENMPDWSPCRAR